METLRLPFKMKWTLKHKSMMHSHSMLEERIVFLTEFVRKASQPPVTPPISVDHVTPAQEPAVNKRSPPPTNNTSTAHISDVHERNIHQNYSRLSKLALPTFSGDPL